MNKKLKQKNHRPINNMSNAKLVINQIKKSANKKQAVILQRFFKTDPGQYGAGDIFCGLMVPQSRAIVKKFNHLTLNENKKLLASKIHEVRLVGLLILVDQFAKSDTKTKAKIVKFYLTNLKAVNNWDLVDLTAHKILGAWLLDKSPAKLYELANSKNLWARRVAIISTFAHIKNNNFQPTLRLAKKLLTDQHDLIHKAVGWMLRELGKKSPTQLHNFLNQHSKTMPRTMLRYAIEKLPPKKRLYYLKKK